MGGWTKDEPTIDGYYWWRADANDWEPDIHEVFDGYFYEIGHPVKTVVANFGGEWLGPIVSDDCIQPGSLNQEQRGRAALLAESRGVDIDTAAELVYLRDRVKELDGAKGHREPGTMGRCRHGISICRQCFIREVESRQTLDNER